MPNYKVTVFAYDGEPTDEDQLEMGTVEVTAPDEYNAVEQAHDALWDSRLDVTCHARYVARCVD